MKRKNKKFNWKLFRTVMQIAFFSFFVILIIITTPEYSELLPVNIFFRANPLVGLTAMISSRSWIMILSLSLVTVIATLLLGRIWCSYICPLGTLLDWVPGRKQKNIKKEMHPFWRYVKYILLFAIITGALFSNLLLMFFDPITIIFRGTAVVIPGISQFIDWFFNLIGVSTPMFLVSRKAFYPINLVFTLMLVAIVLLNFIRKRFWCRYLCPLGALLALISKIPLIRRTVDNNKCISCGKCKRICHTDAIDASKGYISDAAECTSCMECVSACPTNAIGFKINKVNTEKSGALEIDESKRRFIISAGAGLTVFSVVKSLPFVTAAVNPKKSALRPPGATYESLTSKCVRCGYCIKVCPGGILTPDFGDEMIKGVWTPVRIGDCDFGCHACGDVCPTGAIPKVKNMVASQNETNDKRRTL